MPLDVLLNAVNCDDDVHVPDVLVLIGPFVPAEAEVSKSLTEDAYTTFSEGVERVLAHVNERRTKVVLISSPQEAHLQGIYPTVPYRILDAMGSNPSTYPDPSLISVNGLLVGASSTDILFHLNASDLSRPRRTDRMKCLLEYIINQRSFYPLYPPHHSTNVDIVHWEEHCDLPVLPDLLLLPSQLKYFVEEVSGCICINPGRVAMGKSLGSYARATAQNGRFSACVMKL